MENKEMTTDLFHVMKMFEKLILANPMYFSLSQKQTIVKMILNMFPNNFKDIENYIYIKSLEEEMRRHQN